MRKRTMLLLNVLGKLAGKHFRLSIFLLIFAVLGLTVALLSGAQNPTEDFLSRVISAMSYEQKIGQLVMYIPHSEEIPYAELKKFSIGGICLVERSIIPDEEFEKNRGDYAWGLKSRNMRRPADAGKYSQREVIKTLHRVVSQLQTNAPAVQMRSETIRIPMFVAGDFEGGEFPSLAWDVSDIPSMMALSQSRKCSVVYTAGEAIGAQMRALGFNMNFAPVAEIHSGLFNDMMGERAASSDADLAAESAVAFYQGLKKAGVISIAKHFPGHGDAKANPHFVVPAANNSPQTVEEGIKPFMRLRDAGVDGFMTAHVSFPRLSESFKGLPFSLHPTLLPKMAKKHNLENFLWVTDELFDMKSPSKALGYSDPVPPSAYNKLALMAVSAGHDIILIRNSRYIGEAVRALKNYYRDNPAKLDDAVRKILRLKMKVYPNFRVPPLDETQTMEAIISRRKPALEAARQSIVLVKDDFGFFKTPDGKGQKIDIKRSRITAVVPDNGAFAENLVDVMKTEAAGIEITPYYLPYRSGEFRTQDAAMELNEKIQGNFYNLVLKELSITRKDAASSVLLLAFARAREGEFLTKLFKKLARKLGDSMPPTIFIALGAPNNLPVRELAGLRFTYLAASSRNRLMLEAIAETLAGKLRPADSEKLTVAVPGVVEKIPSLWDACH